MANISVHNEINFSLEDEEFEILNKAWNILFNIADELYQSDNEDERLFYDAYDAQLYINRVVKLANREITRIKWKNKRVTQNTFVEVYSR